jgi:hypothetical protein
MKLADSVISVRHMHFIVAFRNAYAVLILQFVFHDCSYVCVALRVAL